MASDVSNEGGLAGGAAGIVVACVACVCFVLSKLLFV